MAPKWSVLNTRGFSSARVETFLLTTVEIDPFHLDFRACAMDWHVKSAGSRGEHVSWVAGRAHSCISLVLVVVKNLAFHGDKMGAKDHCRPIHCTTGWIKARNPTKHLSFSFCKKVKYCIFHNRTDSRMIPSPVCWEWSCCFYVFFFFFLHLIQVYWLCT